MHFGTGEPLWWSVTDNELAVALRRCRRRLYAVAAALVIVPVMLSVLVVAALH